MLQGKERLHDIGIQSKDRETVRYSKIEEKTDAYMNL
jgi:hypothetical protein